jgi:hypothetical protein
MIKVSIKSQAQFVKFLSDYEEAEKAELEAEASLLGAAAEAEVSRLPGWRVKEEMRDFNYVWISVFIPDEWDGPRGGELVLACRAAGLACEFDY